MKKITTSGSAGMPPQGPEPDRWQNMDDLGQRFGKRCVAELRYVSEEVRFVYRVEQAVLLLAFLTDHLEGSNAAEMSRGRRLLDLAREMLDQDGAEAEYREVPDCEDDFNTEVIGRFAEVAGSFQRQVDQLTRMLAAADDCLLHAARERRSELGAFQLMVRSGIDLAKRAIADADAARNLLSASLR